MENWHFDLQIFNPTTIAYLQVAEEKRGVYRWKGNKFVDFLRLWVGMGLIFWWQNGKICVNAMQA